MLDEDCDVMCVCFVMVDYFGLFSCMIGVLVLVGVNVVDVWIYIIKDGYVMVIFWI